MPKSDVLELLKGQGGWNPGTRDVSWGNRQQPVDAALHKPGLGIRIVILGVIMRGF